MNHSIIICDSESYNNIDKNNDKILFEKFDKTEYRKLLHIFIHLKLNDKKTPISILKRFILDRCKVLKIAR